MSADKQAIDGAPQLPFGDPEAQFIEYKTKQLSHAAEIATSMNRAVSEARAAHNECMAVAQLATHPKASNHQNSLTLHTRMLADHAGSLAFGLQSKLPGIQAICYRNGASEVTE